jgi:hypothetical protein
LQEVYAFAPTLPIVYVEALRNKYSTMSFAYSAGPWAGSTPEFWAARGVDGDLMSIMHTIDGPAQNVQWWRADTGYLYQPIDRISLLNRPHYVNCRRYFMRDDFMDLAFSSTPGALTFDGATPAGE